MIAILSSLARELEGQKLSNRTKNQHYVPRLLLRHFATGVEEEVQVFDSTRTLSRSSIVRRVFSQNFFYDDDNSMEAFLAKEIESPANGPIKAIVADPAQLIVPGHPALLLFIAVQMTRTPGARHELMNFVDAFSGSLFEQLAELNDLSIEAVKNLRLRPKDPRAVGNELLLRSTLSCGLMEDLSWHVLTNSTDLPFVISDHPVVHYNWYLKDSNDPGYTGITKRGVQIFLPLSPSVTLALIDKSVYKFGEKGSRCTELHDKRDVELLNSLQFRSRQDFIVFPLGMDAGYVQRCCTDLPADSLGSVHASRTDPVPISDNKLSSYVIQWRRQVSYANWLTVCRIKRRVSKRVVECFDRSPENVAAYQTAVRELFDQTNS
ncbi:MAG: DUF4238 domain-containing protein [Hydrogenophaga sp.]|nr:DUF4238 domain-containing protein [Hydrogenophaga sp.]